MTKLTEIFPLPGILPVLREGDLQLWSADLRNCDAECEVPVQVLLNLLSAEEQARAQNYRGKAAAEQFVRVRALLRILLGQYLQQDPASIEISCSVNGKPALTKRDGKAPIRFNISHSQGRVLYAFTVDDEVGVDIEALNPKANYLKLAHRVCTVQERLIFDQLPLTKQAAAFFRLWTRKEAVIKLFGDRLYKKLSVIEVPMQAESDGFWIQVENRTVWLQDLYVGKSFTGSVALLKRPKCVIQQSDWSSLLSPYQAIFPQP